MPRSHAYEALARVKRTTIGDEVLAVELFLIRDTDTVEIADGDEFVTLLLDVDPAGLFKPRTD